MREPDEPSACPSAIAPPYTFTRAGSSRSSRRHAIDCDAKASFISTRSICSIVSPALKSTLRVAGIGPSPISNGSTPATAGSTTRANGRRAPSAGYSQGVHFVVLDGTALAGFWQVTGAAEWFADVQPGVLDAPVVVLPLADPVAYTSRYAEGDKSGHGLEHAANWEVPFGLTDTAMAVQNLLLLAEDRGLGALYFGIFRNARSLLDHLGVPPHVLQVGAVALGHRAADDRPSGSSVSRQRRERADVVHLGHW